MLRPAALRSAIVLATLLASAACARPRPSASAGQPASSTPVASTPVASTHVADTHVASTTVPVPGGCSTPRTGAADAPGCFLAGTEQVGPASAAQLYWYVDRYPTRADAEAARRAQGRGMVTEAHGGVWLFTIAEDAWGVAGGERVSRVGPLPVTPGRRYAAHYLESVVPPGARTPLHRHPGPEAWYVLEGTQCLETPEGFHVMRAGESFVVPEGQPMLLVGVTSTVRRSFALVLHDAAQPWTIPASDWTPRESCPR